MKRIIFTFLFLITIYSANSQVIKYRSENYDIEKPGVSGYKTIYESSNHIFDFKNNMVTLQIFNGEGANRRAYYVKKYSIKNIGEESMYYILNINSNGMSRIYLPKYDGGNIEYDFTTGVHWVFYELQQFK